MYKPFYSNDFENQVCPRISDLTKSCAENSEAPMRFQLHR